MYMTAASANPYSTVTIQTNKKTGEQTFSIDPTTKNDTQSLAVTDMAELETYKANICIAKRYDSRTGEDLGYEVEGRGISISGKCVGWNAKNTEKPETLSHVPDKLWDAFINTEGIMNNSSVSPTAVFSNMFFLPKWDIHLTEEPPTLNKVEPTEERMLSYDYLSIIDKDIERRVRDGITPDDMESLDLLYRLRENIASVLNYPLTENSEDVSDYRFHLAFSGSEDVLINLYIIRSTKYQLNLQDKAVDQSMADHNIPEEYKPQLAERLNKDAELQSNGETFLGNLLNTNSNIFDGTETAPNISKEWYATFLAEHIGKVIEEMGTPGTPEGEWEVPILWEIKQTQITNQKESACI